MRRCGFLVSCVFLVDFRAGKMPARNQAHGPRIRAGGLCASVPMALPHAVSSAAQALATAVTCSGLGGPGTAAHPPFSTNSDCDHASVFFSASLLATTSVACVNL